MEELCRKYHSVRFNRVQNSNLTFDFGNNSLVPIQTLPTRTTGKLPIFIFPPSFLNLAGEPLELTFALFLCQPIKIPQVKSYLVAVVPAANNFGIFNWQRDYDAIRSGRVNLSNTLNIKISQGNTVINRNRPCLHISHVHTFICIVKQPISNNFFISHRAQYACHFIHALAVSFSRYTSLFGFSYNYIIKGMKTDQTINGGCNRTIRIICPTRPTT